MSGLILMLIVVGMLVVLATAASVAGTDTRDGFAELPNRRPRP